ncbi:MAG: dipicolinate synthase subunit DpsA [Clostridia bacterium]|nr:dipicolinate synthase subunit DpsA [Clostridia bacterium]
MNQNRKFAVIGGDLRSIRLANLLHMKGNFVNAFGICHEDLIAPRCADLTEALDKSELLILPLPMLNKSDCIYAPFYKDSIELNDLLRAMNKNQILFGGKISAGAKKRMDMHGVYAVDYFQREDLTVANAMITAEGAMQTLLNVYQKTVCSSKILILGYGRIGKFLAKILSGFSADITVAGRRDDTRIWVTSSGYHYADIHDDKTYTGAFDVVFNTAPNPILTKERIMTLQKDCIIIDLASAPGGTDFDAASAYGIQALHALSLPGKTAPISAGDAIASTILNICNDLGV